METDVFVRDMMSGALTLISRTSTGALSNGHSYNPAISGDGRWVAFISSATNLDPRDTDDTPDIYIHDRWTGETSLAWDNGPRSAHTVTMTEDGRYLGATYRKTCYFDNECVHDIYVYDRQKDEVLDDLKHIEMPGLLPAAIADGPIVTFTTEQSLLAEDVNDTWDAYRYDYVTQELRLISMTHSGQSGNRSSGDTSMSRDGKYVAFTSWASDLIFGDTNDESDVFVWSEEVEHIFVPMIR